MKKSKKVVIGLSGGVDSSVAAFLLKRKGFSVTGVFMRFWSEKEENRCCSSKGEERARKIAERLDIPFYVVNLSDRFKKRVVDPFLTDLKKGDTPNPCTICNREVKFKSLFESLITCGADYVATGHYARIKEEAANNKLLKGKDKRKDQSYFLWNLKREWLSKILFPLGENEKEKVREIAKKENLPTANTEESQEICFVSDKMNSFLERNIGRSPGEITDVAGNILGEHKGLFYHTIGQRKGLNLPGGPYYVLEKERDKNRLIVTESKKDLLKREVSFKKENFLQDVSFPLKVRAKIRYNGKESSALLKENKAVFSSPLEAVTPGQSIVFYRGEEVVGGGVIE